MKVPTKRKCVLIVASGLYLWVATWVPLSVYESKLYKTFDWIDWGMYAIASWAVVEMFFLLIPWNEIFQRKEAGYVRENV